MNLPIPALSIQPAQNINDGFHLLNGALSQSDIRSLIDACKAHLNQPDAIPSYVFIDHLNNPVVDKIQSAVEAVAGCKMHYLNDFYLYTEGNKQAHWHVDTELFTFGKAYNAWLLLSPDQVPSPLAMMAEHNQSDENYFHTVKFKDGDDNGHFANMKNGRKCTTAIEEIEGTRIESPSVSVGDILIFNPKRFHKTNIESPKHIIAFKFVAKTDNGFKSTMQVPGIFWPEIKIFNAALKANDNWDGVLDHIRAALKTPDGRRALSAGFFPERLEMFREKVAAL